MDDKEIKRGVEMLESLHRAVKARAATRGIKLKQAVHEALSGWLAGETKPVGIHQGIERQWHAMLDQVLEDPEERVAIERLLLHTSMAVGSKPKRIRAKQKVRA